MKKPLFENIGKHQFRLSGKKRSINENYKTTLTREDPTTGQETEIPVLVQYDARPYYRGDRGDYGEPMSPEEPATLDITRVIDLTNNQEIDISPEENERLKDEISSNTDNPDDLRADYERDLDR